MPAVGIDPPDEGIEITLPPVFNEAQVLLVHNWTTGGANGSNVNGHLGSEYPYINIPSMIHGACEFVGVASYSWRMADVSDVQGITAQAPGLVSNPASMWGNHGIAQVGEVYYDPSYGVTYVNTQEIDNIFWGFGRNYIAWEGPQGPGFDEGAVNLDLDGDGVVTPGNMVKTPAFIFKENPEGVQIQLDPQDIVR
ncbi:MAG: hypothetical protein ACR2GY_06185 [Phycisphaerales bacterium]